MQKILIATGIYPPDIGGPATYAKLIADHFGDDAKVVTYTRLLRKIPQPFRKMIFFIKLWRASRQANMIYALSPLGTGVATALLGKPFVVRVAGDRAWEDAVNARRTHLLLDDFQKLKNRGLKHKLQVWVCKRARAVVVPSQYLARIVAGWGISMEKIKLVHNAVNSAVEPLGQPLGQKAVQPLGIHGHIIVSMGRLVPWKGFRMLIKLMPQFLEINPFFRLVIVGDGPDLPVLQAMVKNLRLEGKVYLVGKKPPEETARYLASADLFVLNSGYEGFSHTILEAMAASVPVITTAAGGNHELIRQGENGFMVKYNDEFNLVEAVKTLWESQELREKFIAQGRATAAEYFPERMIKETIQALEL